MSHSFRAKDKTFFSYNSDLSGPVEITVMSTPEKPAHSIKVSGSALMEFVAQWLRFREVCRVENLEDHEILGLKKEDLP
jgi:hypothetical protein